MSIVINDLPVSIKQKEMNYNDFISLLSKKSTLNNISNSSIEFEWVEDFDKKEEKKILDLDSVKWLYNSL